MSTEFKPQKPTTVAELRRLLADAPDDMPIVFALGCTRSYHSPEVQTPRVLSEQFIGYNGNDQLPAAYKTEEDADYEGQRMLVLSALPFGEDAHQHYDDPIFLNIDRSPLIDESENCNQQVDGYYAGKKVKFRRVRLDPNFSDGRKAPGEPGPFYPHDPFYTYGT